MIKLRPAPCHDGPGIGLSMNVSPDQASGSVVPLTSAGAAASGGPALPMRSRHVV
jgi:hypothetical protein